VLVILMNPNVTNPPSFYVRHRASGQLRRVSTLRIWFDGSVTFQFFQVVKHEGQTIFFCDSEECDH
jgi:hypothetical protein